MNMWQHVEMRIRFINLNVMLQLNGESGLYSKRVMEKMVYNTVLLVVVEINSEVAIILVGKNMMHLLQMFSGKDIMSMIWKVFLTQHQL